MYEFWSLVICHYQDLIGFLVQHAPAKSKWKVFITNQIKPGKMNKIWMNSMINCSENGGKTFSICSIIWWFIDHEAICFQTLHPFQNLWIKTDSFKMTPNYQFFFIALKQI